jgi:hypothetical protein
MEGQRRALGYAPMSPEAIAGERYGEVSAYLGDERARQQYQEQLDLQKQQLALQGELGRGQLALGGARTGIDYMNQQRLARAGKTSEWGQAIAGGALLANVGDKLGLFSKTGLPAKAYTGLFGGGGGGGIPTSTGYGGGDYTYGNIDWSGTGQQYGYEGMDIGQLTNMDWGQYDIFTDSGYGAFSDFMTWL